MWEEPEMQRNQYRLILVAELRTYFTAKAVHSE